MPKRREWTQWLAAALMLALSYAVFYALVQRPSSDISIHAAWASEGNFADPSSFVHHAAHPLWHMLVAALMLTGLPLNAAAALVTALAKAAETWLLVELSARLMGERGWRATLCGLMLSVVTAVAVSGVNPRVYLGAGSPNTWHSPTQILAMVAMLLCVPMTADIAEGFHRRLPEDGAKTNVPKRDAALLSALLVISLLAKPTFLQAFLPAAGLYFLILLIRKPRNAPFFWRMVAVAAPSIVVMFLQYLYYFKIYTVTQGSMMVLVTWEKTGDVALKVLLTQAFPIFALFTCTEKATFRKPLYQMTLLMNAASVLELLLFSEAGRRAADGNFGWAMMGATLMLWALTLPLFMKKLQKWFAVRRAAAKGQPYLEGDNPRGEAIKWGAGAALLLWHLASGVYYIVYLLTTTNAL
jgi:hypothetical protein